jgi:hypothetical protein
MRNIRGAALGVMAVGAMAVVFGASSPLRAMEPVGPPKEPVRPPPPVRPVGLVKITSFTRITPEMRRASVEGSNKLHYAIGLHNGDSTATSVKLHFARFGNAEQPTQSVTVAGLSDATVDVQDEMDGMNCGLAYSLWLEGVGTDTRKRSASLVSTCTFTTRVSDSLDLMTPDRADGERAGHVYFTNAKVGNYACPGMHVDVDLVNHSTRKGTGLEVSLHDVTGASTWQGSLQPLLPGQVQHVSFNTGTLSGAPGTMKFQLIDPVQSLGGMIAGQIVSIQVTATCSAHTQLVP